MRGSFDVLITTLGEALSLIVILDSLLSFAMPLDHPVREALGRILQPLYAPIRRFLPQTGMIDFSPLVLLLLIQLFVIILTSLI